MRDPTSSESYIALRNALVAIRDDASSVRSILSAVSDGGKGWAAIAYWELRAALQKGRLGDANTVGRLIGHVLALSEPQDEPDGKAPQDVHAAAMAALEEGIAAVLGHDHRTALAHLQAVIDAADLHPAMRWAGCFWAVKAFLELGELQQAASVCHQAVELSADLGWQAHGSSLCRMAEVGLLGEDYSDALDHAGQAAELFAEAEDERGLATARLASARLLDRLGRSAEALDVAASAQEADPDWEEPAVYLSQRALAGDAIGLALQVLQPFLSSHRSHEVDRQERIVKAVQAGQASRELALELIDLRSRPASSETVEALRKLWDSHRDFVELRESLAWHLVKIGEREEAAAHFEQMATMELAPELRSSVMLGLGCLASQKNEHRQPGARVHAASAAFSTAGGRGPTAEQEDGAVSSRAGDRGPPLRLGDLDIDSVSLEDVVSQLELGDDGGKRPALPPPPPFQRRKETQSGNAAPDSAGRSGTSKSTSRPRRPPPKGAAAAGDSTVGPSAVGLMSSNTEPHVAIAATDPPSKAKAVFTGSLQLFAVPDLLDFLSASRRTGTLVITSEEGIGAVHMRDGAISGAATPKSRSMGKLLVEDNALTAEALADSVEKQRAEGGSRLLGNILIEMGLVEQSQLTRVLAKQAKDALREMVDWTDGRFAFEPDHSGENLPVEGQLDLDTRAVLLDVLREYDEANK